MSRLELGWDLKLYNDMLDVLESQISDINRMADDISKKYTREELEIFRDDIEKINIRTRKILEVE